MSEPEGPQDPLFYDDEPQSMLGRILPPLVLICAFGGFIALAIYAYQAGTQSVNDGELMVIEADNSPIKEKPADPGGMQFPNQDKTIFETFAANSQNPPKVERVLPTPEEPLANNGDGETTTWVNGKLSPPATAASPAGAEQVFGDDDAAPAPVKEEPKPSAQVMNVQEELGKQAVAEAPAAPEVKTVELAPAEKAAVAAVNEVVKKAAAEAKAAEKTMVKPVEVKEVPVAEKAVAPKPVAEKPAPKPVAKAAPEKPKASKGKGLVQLGAYKSDAEAKGDFAKMQKKHAALAGKSPTINRADLGDKGIFFRLRVATDDPKALCAKLSGQACMVVR